MKEVRRIHLELQLGDVYNIQFNALNTEQFKNVYNPQMLPWHAVETSIVI